MRGPLNPTTIYFVLFRVERQGCDLSDEPESLVLHLLREMRAEMTEVRSEIASIKDVMVTKDEFRSEMHSLRADVASDLATLDAKVDRTR